MNLASSRSHCIFSVEARAPSPRARAWESATLRESASLRESANLRESAAVCETPTRLAEDWPLLVAA